MEYFDDFIRQIGEKLKSDLPGSRAQLKMAPITRKHYLEKGADISKARRAAVLIIFFPRGNRIFTVLIQRNTYDGVHSGQISLPGGKLEPGDVSLRMAALRETEEEIGIPREKIEVIGELSEIYIPPSEFRVLPVIGYIDHEPAMKPDPSEVAKIIPIDVGLLINDNVIQDRIVETRNGLQIRVPCFCIDNQIVWGATAMILSELTELIKNPLIQ